MTETIKSMVVPTDENGRELKGHGTPLFPLQCYHSDVTLSPVNWHWHEEWEVVACTCGKLQVSTPGIILTLEEGDGLFIGGNVLHEIVGIVPQTLIRSAVFHPRFISGMDSIIWQNWVQPLMEVSGVIPLYQRQLWQKECTELLLDCWQAVFRSETGYELIARGDISKLAFLLSTNAAPSRQMVSTRELKEIERLKLMLQYIETHYMESLTNVRIAESASVSESECLRCFKRTVHTTPGRYLKDLRLQKAVAMLIDTDEKVGDIGTACGFLDPAYFTKLFREAKGCTPKEYRRNFQNQKP